MINNIHEFIPVGTVFKTYIKRDSTTVWEELIPGFEQSWYEFFIMNDNLAVWSSGMKRTLLTSNSFIRLSCPRMDEELNSD